MQDPQLGVWHNIDPLGEKYSSFSPYNYTMDNPIKLIDPNGKDVYRFDDKTGEFKLAKKTDDKFDQVGKFSYDKKTKSYTLREDKKGNAKTSIDGIAKGILKDGINFKTQDNVFKVGGEGQPTREGIENFALKLSNYLNIEIKGAYFSDAENPSAVALGSYEKNTHTDSYGPEINSGATSGLSLAGFFHTHPTRGIISSADPTQPGPMDRQDRDDELRRNPNLKFYIITDPASYREPNRRILFNDL